MRARNSSGQSGRVDAAAKNLAERVATRYSRRSWLYNLSAGAAALLGVKFVAPQAIDTLVRMPLAEGAPAAGPVALPQGATVRCDHDDANPCAANGPNCGMGNAVDCLAYKKNDKGKDSVCFNCWDHLPHGRGCPKGTRLSAQAWDACCKCLQAAHPGHFFRYRDCCLTAVQPLDPRCASAACQAAVAGSGCNNVAGCNIPDRFNPWCGPGGGDPICTLGVDTRENCS